MQEKDKNSLANQHSGDGHYSLSESDLVNVAPPPKPSTFTKEGHNNSVLQQPRMPMKKSDSHNAVSSARPSEDAEPYSMLKDSPELNDENVLARGDSPGVLGEGVKSTGSGRMAGLTSDTQAKANPVSSANPHDTTPTPLTLRPELDRRTATVFFQKSQQAAKKTHEAQEYTLQREKDESLAAQVEDNLLDALDEGHITKDPDEPTFITAHDEKTIRDKNRVFQNSESVGPKTQDEINAMLATGTRAYMDTLPKNSGDDFCESHVDGSFDQQAAEAALQNSSSSPDDHAHASAKAYIQKNHHAKNKENKPYTEGVQPEIDDGSSKVFVGDNADDMLEDTKSEARQDHEEKNADVDTGEEGDSAVGGSANGESSIFKQAGKAVLTGVAGLVVKTATVVPQAAIAFGEQSCANMTDDAKAVTAPMLHTANVINPFTKPGEGLKNYNMYMKQSTTADAQEVMSIVDGSAKIITDSSNPESSSIETEGNSEKAMSTFFKVRHHIRTNFKSRATDMAFRRGLFSVSGGTASAGKTKKKVASGAVKALKFAIPVILVVVFVAVIIAALNPPNINEDQMSAVLGYLQAADENVNAEIAALAASAQHVSFITDGTGSEDCSVILGLRTNAIDFFALFPHSRHIQNVWVDGWEQTFRNSGVVFFRTLEEAINDFHATTFTLDYERSYVLVPVMVPEVCLCAEPELCDTEYGYIQTQGVVLCDCGDEYCEDYTLELLYEEESAILIRLVQLSLEEQMEARNLTESVRVQVRSDAQASTLAELFAAHAEQLNPNLPQGEIRIGVPPQYHITILNDIGFSAPATTLSYPSEGQRFGAARMRLNSAGVRVRVPGAHGGVDLTMAPGTPVFAAHDGVVIRSIHNVGSDGIGAGHWITIESPCGQISTCYMHLGVRMVNAGQHVTRGQQIATSGTSGTVSGWHLHFEMWMPARPRTGNTPNTRIDPYPFLFGAYRPTP